SFEDLYRQLGFGRPRQCRDRAALADQRRLRRRGRHHRVDLERQGRQRVGVRRDLAAADGVGPVTEVRTRDAGRIARRVLDGSAQRPVDGHVYEARSPSAAIVKIGAEALIAAGSDPTTLFNAIVFVVAAKSAQLGAWTEPPEQLNALTASAATTTKRLISRLPMKPNALVGTSAIPRTGNIKDK